MKNKVMIGAVACAIAGAAWADSVKYVDEFDLSGMAARNGTSVAARRNVNGGELFVGEAKFERGIGTTPDCAVAFRLNGNAVGFDAVVGLDKKYEQYQGTGFKDRVGAFFNVWVDGRLVWKSGLLWADRNDMKVVRIDLKGAKEIVLESTVRTDHWGSLDAVMANWGDAKFTLKDGAEIAPVEAARLAQHGILTPKASDAPRFNGADIWGVRPGKPVIFRVPVSGKRPMELKAENLPEGVTFDPRLGVLGGTAPAKAGDYVVTVTAKNAHGEAKRDVTLRVGKTISLTPPMGWNSWNICTSHVTGDDVRRNAKAMHESGLADYGYSYVNIDDCWMRFPYKANWRDDLGGALRDGKGRILPNASFPDMKGLVDEIHGYGFKAGIYSSPGETTCTGCAGSLGHEKEDAEQYAEWGFDYLKYDLCSYSRKIGKEAEELRKNGVKDVDWVALHKKPYAVMGRHLLAQNRDIMYSIGQGGGYGVGDWGSGDDVGGNVFRTSGDLKDMWSWLLAGLGRDKYFSHVKPGFWADPDMMVVGKQTSFALKGHDTFLKPNEQYSHVGVWAMVASPILVGCDMTQLDEFTKSLLCNSEIIEVSQDRLGKSAAHVVNEPDRHVWVKEMSNGDKVVAVMNAYCLSRTMKVDFGKLGLGAAGEWKVRDLWRQKDLGVKRGGFDADVLGHMTEVWRFSKVK